MSKQPIGNMSYESFDDIKFNLGPFLQGQTGSFSLHTGTYIQWIHFASGSDAGRLLSSFTW